MVRARVDYTGAALHVEYRPGRGSPEALARALADPGYQASLVGDAPVVAGGSQ
ncbi:MAG: hypothetical protein HY319_31720 [Armatimonadetes bacterium]|nr:hypothetical protein [Armatimonadota bacterium]